MDISFDYKQALALIWQQLQLDDVKASVVKLKGIDWNPFNEDGDEFHGVFAEIHHNWELVDDTAVQIVTALERVVVGANALTNEQKHKVAVDILDNLIRVPFYLEPFDGVLLDIIVKGAVKFANAFDWGVELPETVPAVIAFKEIG